MNLKQIQEIPGSKTTGLYCIVQRKKIRECKRVSIDASAAKHLDVHFVKVVGEFWEGIVETCSYEAFSANQSNEMFVADVGDGSGINLPTDFSKCLKGDETVDLLEPNEIAGVISLFWVWEDRDEKKAVAAFQTVGKPARIKKRSTLFLRGNTFSFDSGDGLSIRTDVQVLYRAGKIYFTREHLARRILDFHGHVTAATEKQVDAFYRHPKLLPLGKPEYNLYIARKIAHINTLKVLDVNKISEIALAAKKHNIDLKIKSGRLEIPQDAKALKEFLCFLTEDIFFGWSQSIRYQASGKRTL